MQQGKSYLEIRPMRDSHVDTLSIIHFKMQTLPEACGAPIGILPIPRNQQNSSMLQLVIVLLLRQVGENYQTYLGLMIFSVIQ